MQITHVEVVPVELKLAMPHRAAVYPEEVERAGDARGTGGLGMCRL
jgi:hypothetical protein